MATREEKIAFIQAQAKSASQAQMSSGPSREEKIAFIQNQAANAASSSPGILDMIISAAQTVDSYTGAPARTAIREAQKGNFKGAIPAAARQFGEDPNMAPSGKEIVEAAGVSNTALSDVVPSIYSDSGEGLPLKKGGLLDPTASGTVGVAMDMAADPLNIVPIGALARGAKTAAKGTIAAGAGAAKTIAEGAGKAAQVVPGANAVMVAAEAAKEGAGNVADALKTMFTPTQADDYKSLLDIAKKNGIDPKLLPESIEFGEGSFISRASRNRAEGVLGEPHLKRFEQGLEAVQGATENKIAKISGGSVPSAVEAGELLRSGYDDAVDNLFNDVDFTYNSVLDQVPGIRLTDDAAAKIDSKLNGIEKTAKGLAQRGITATERGQADQLMRAVEAIRASNGSLKQLNEAMSMIGKHAFKKGGNSLSDIPVDQKKFQEIYFSLRDGFLESTAAQLGPKIAQKLVDSNALITNFNKDKEIIAGIIGNRNLAPEKVFASLVEQGDTKKIEALKRMLPREKLQALKGAFLSAQIKRGADGSFTFKSLNNNLRNKKNVLGALFDANEINELAEIIKLGERFGSPVLSTSGTGASSLFSDIGKGIRSSVESDTIIGLLKDRARSRAEKTANALSPPKPKLEAPKRTTQSKNPKLSDDQRAVSMFTIMNSPKVTSTQEKDVQENKELKRGKDRWAEDGYKKLVAHAGASDAESSDIKERLMKDKKLKELLILASDFKPESKAMNNIVERINKRLKEIEK